jgi:hypothetical protein
MGNLALVSILLPKRIIYILIILLDQAAVILPLLTRFGITLDNLGYFVLDNALKNDITL